MHKSSPNSEEYIHDADATIIIKLVHKKTGTGFVSQVKIRIKCLYWV